MAEKATDAENTDGNFRLETNWPKVLLQLHVHIFLLYGVYFMMQAKLLTIVFTFFLVAIGILGITAGAHRLWAHQSYTASFPLKIFLMICYTVTGNGTIYDWVLDHRLHHKFHGTNDDPYNYKRGFLYAHMGPRIYATNPKRAELEKGIDMSDLDEDMVVTFQKRFYWVLMPIVTLLLPINAPVEYWDEKMLISILLIFFRIPVLLHASWLVNSGRSVWGLVPNDRFYSDSNLVFLINKTRWNEYHYTVPWDFLTGEFGSYNRGCTTALIKIWAVMGLAKDLKTMDSRGTTIALKHAIDTGKPIGECMAEYREKSQQNVYEDNFLQ